MVHFVECRGCGKVLPNCECKKHNFGQIQLHQRTPRTSARCQLFQSRQLTWVGSVRDVVVAMHRMFKNVIPAEHQHMQLFKAYVAWCNKLTTLYFALGWSFAGMLSKISQGDLKHTLIGLGFIAFFRVMIHLHEDYKK